MSCENGETRWQEVVAQRRKDEWKSGSVSMTIGTQESLEQGEYVIGEGNIVTW